MLSVNQVTETGGLADQAPLKLAAHHIGQPPVAVSTVVENYLRVASAGEVADPDWMLPVNQVAEAGGLADQAPMELAAHHIGQPPVAVSTVVEYYLRVASAGEVADPDGMLSVNQVAETGGLADQAPLKLAADHIGQPPVAIPTVVENYLRVASAGEVADPDGMLSVNQVAEAS